MMKSTKSARRETASCTEGKKEKRKLPDLKPWAIGLLYLVCAGASAGAILQASLGLLPEAAGYKKTGARRRPKPPRKRPGRSYFFRSLNRSDR